MMVYSFLRISNMLLRFSLLYVCMVKTVCNAQTSSIYPLTFYLQSSPSRGVTRLGQGWTESSVVSCAKSCMAKYQACKSFMFNPNTGLCTPGSFSYSNTAPLPNTAEGKFYHSVSCEVNEGFSYRRYGSAEACIGIFGPTMTYTQADNACRSMGGFLASVKTYEKLQLIMQIRGTRDVWIGCDDLVQSGLYVWKEDGESFTYATKPNTFSDPEPLNGHPDENCIMLHANWASLNDQFCSATGHYACEMALH